MQKAVEVKSLTFTYLGQNKPVLRNISFFLNRGELLLVLGPTGSGKTTLVLTLNGIIPNFIPGELDGEIRVFGKDPREEGIAEMAKHVGFVFQDPESQVVAFTVEEEVAFGLENLLVPIEEIEERVEFSLKKVGMYEKRKDPVDSLSLGQKQKLALASAIALSPKLLILDEPTAHLDPVSAREFYSYVKELKEEGTTIIVIEHRLDYVFNLVDRILFLENGNVEAFGYLNEVLGRVGIQRLRNAGIWLPENLLMKTRRKNPGVEEIRKLDDIVLDAKHIGYVYPGGNVALVDISLKVSRGDVTCIIGPNGSGKTTFLKIAAGVMKPTKGSIRVLDGLPSPKKVAFVMQNPEHQFVAKTVIEDLAASFIAEGFTRDEALQVAEEILNKKGLSELKNRSLYELSQGEKRLISILSMAVLHRPLVLMDEPTFGLDRKYSVKVVQEIMELKKNKVGIIVVTHDTWLTTLICDKVVGFLDGKTIFQGRIEELLIDREFMRLLRFDMPPGIKVLLDEGYNIEEAVREYRLRLGG